MKTAFLPVSGLPSVPGTSGTTSTSATFAAKPGRKIAGLAGLLLTFSAWVVLVLALATAFTPAHAQFLTDNPDWLESEAPPPPAFDMARLLTVDVSPNSLMSYGVDPATVVISKSDGIIRYVMVAVSNTGVKNAMYEALRCSTGEFKTYARQSNEGKWNAIDRPEWRSVYSNLPSKHALRFAKAGACDNASMVVSVNALVARLKSSAYRGGLN